jgi:hypothetical protein
LFKYVYHASDNISATVQKVLAGSFYVVIYHVWDSVVFSYGVMYCMGFGALFHACLDDLHKFFARIDIVRPDIYGKLLNRTTH